MSEKIELVLATEEDAKLIHEMKYEAFCRYIKNIMMMKQVRF